MPKKLSHSKFLAPLSKSLEVGTVEAGIITQSFVPLVVALLDTNGGTPVMATTFNLAGLGARTAIIEFEISCLVSTDAAPGTTSLTVYADQDTAATTSRLTLTGPEIASQTDSPVIHRGKILIYSVFDNAPSIAGVSFSAYRLNRTSLYAQQGTASVSVNDLIELDITDNIAFKVQLSSSDASTTFNANTGHMILYPMPPIHDWDTGEVIT